METDDDHAYTFHWQRKRTSCSLMGKYGLKDVGNHAIWFVFLIYHLKADSGGNFWCLCNLQSINGQVDIFRDIFVGYINSSN